MAKAEVGRRVKLHYTLKLKSGEVVGTSKRSMPLEFRIGKGKVIRKLETGVIGMEPGESRRIEVSPEEGYGRRNEELVIRLAKGELPSREDIAVGRTVQYMNESGSMVNFVIAATDEDSVTLDANHPLAGKDLVYEVVLVAVH
jgi:FKBP-type peptidyl-prolyl cis-trans isomerase 2